MFLLTQLPSARPWPQNHPAAKARPFPRGKGPPGFHAVNVSDLEPGFTDTYSMHIGFYCLFPGSRLLRSFAFSGPGPLEKEVSVTAPLFKTQHPLVNAPLDGGSVEEMVSGTSLQRAGS